MIDNLSPIGRVDVGTVRELARRLIGDAADRIDVDHRPVNRGTAAFGYQAVDDKLIIKAGDLPAATAGLAHYLTRHCDLTVGWDRPAVAPLDRLPDAPATERSSPAIMRYYLNSVTTGYSAPYWDWDRWEREIDWMALHGVTSPLAAVGHETVLLRTFTALGADDAEVRRWLGGAAHLPWTFLGSTNSHGGPLPEHWYRRRAELGARILRRQRSLGMRAVLPAFGGHVPDSLAPAGTARTTWQGFSTALLRPGDGAFERVAAEFYRQQRELFGTDHLYAADPFIESVPPAGDPDQLAAATEATFRGMQDADPAAVWVMQAWPFHYHRRFWTTERIAAVTGAVPADRLLLLDLWAEHAPVWNDGRGIADRPWLWCAVHNFGGRFSVHGDPRGLADDLGGVIESARTERSAQAGGAGSFRGVGLAMEAIENNAVVYDLALELVWERPDLPAWVADHARRRYGLPADGPAAERSAEAWRILLDTLYDLGRTRSIPSPVIARPWDVVPPFHTQRLAGEFLDPNAPVIISANIDAEADPRVEGDLPAIAEAAGLLLTVAGDPAARRGPAGHDLVDLLTHLVAQRTRAPIRGIVAAAGEGDTGRVRRHGSLLLQAIADLNELAATQPDRLLGRWLESAAGWGETPAERRLFRRDARRLLTVWGDQDSGLHDYSGRHWAGLLTGFYLPRWQLWIDWLADAADRGEPPEVAALRAMIIDWEESWIGRDETGPTEPAGDLVTIAGRVLDHYRAPLLSEETPR